VPGEIRQFFERYRDAFNRLDGDAVARLFAVPSGIAHDKGYTHWPTFEAVRANMIALCDLYRSHGFEKARFEPSSFLAQGEKFAVADLAWKIDRRDGQEAWQFRTSYNLMRTEEGWRVLCCTAYEEKRLHA
jgi:ketosteroid isomerase-like protein